MSSKNTGMNRKDARKLAMQIYYQLDINKDKDASNYDHYVKGLLPGKQDAYLRRLYELYFNEGAFVDSLISKYSVDWDIRRMPKTDLAVLRLAAMEILFLDDIPDAVSANEAVELAKTYGTQDSPRFINAIVGKIIREEKK